MPDKVTKFELLDNVLSKNIGWINAADTKAGFIFLINTTMLGFLVSKVPDAQDWTHLLAIVMTFSVLLLGGSTAYVLLSNFPRLKGTYTSYIYFGGAAKMERSAYTQKMLHGVTVDLLEDAAKQCHQTAIIANQKFKNLTWAFCLLCASVPFWLATLYFLYSKSDLPSKFCLILGH